MAPTIVFVSAFIRSAPAPGLAEADRHADHHLNTDPLFGTGGIDPHDDTARPRANADAAAEFHVLVQLREVPIIGDPAEIPWPLGDQVEKQALPANIDSEALNAASDWVFDRLSPEQDTLSLIVVYKGEIIHERYADGVDMTVIE